MGVRRLRDHLGRLASLLAVAALVLLAAIPLSAMAASAPSGSTRSVPAAHEATTARAASPLGVTASRVATTPVFNWGLAYIYYAPTDDKTRFMGEGAATVVDDQTKNITTFGGEGAGGLTPYTMDYNYSTGAFNVTTLNPSPSARTNVSFASVPGRNFAVLFGGLTNLTTDHTANDTWVYYFVNQTWRNVSRPIAPPSREGAAFAVNSSGGRALLEGGWDPAAVIGGSPATVFWNDTWSLNLTTFVWTELHPVVAPPPLYGSGMIWQNATNEFDLFGGCALTCSSDLWSFGGQPAHWARVAAIGALPTARGSPAFVWDAVDGLAVLYGGFSWGASGAIAIGSGSLFVPATRSWTPLDAGGGPGPVYDAANAWAEFPGCEGLVMTGGNTALAGPPTNASVLERFAGNFTNCFPDLISGGSSPPPPPCSVQSVPLQVRVVDNITGRGIANATVAYTGRCVENLHGTTDFYGELSLTLPAPDLLNFTATATGYRPGALQAILLPNTSEILTIPLTPYPSLSVHTFGLGVSGVPYPLGNVSVQIAGYEVLGNSTPSGVLNVPDLAYPPGPMTLEGLLPNYSKASATVVVPPSGLVSVNLTLDADGELDVRVVDNTTGHGIAGAAGELRNIDIRGPGVDSFTTSASGWFNFSKEGAANYSVSATAPGYAYNITKVDHVWIARQTVVLRLPRLVGGELDALVRDVHTGAPIFNALVVIATFGNTTTNLAGWANITDVKPPALYEVVASHAGYRSNFSFVSLSYGLKVAPYLILLSPLPPCPVSPGCIPSTTGASPPPFSYLTGGRTAGLLILGTPAALLAAGIAYALLASRRTRPSPPPPAPGRTG